MFLTLEMTDMRRNKTFKFQKLKFRAVTRADESPLIAAGSERSARPRSRPTVVSDRQTDLRGFYLENVQFGHRKIYSKNFNGVQYSTV